MGLWRVLLPMYGLESGKGEVNVVAAVAAVVGVVVVVVVVVFS